MHKQLPLLLYTVNYGHYSMFQYVYGKRNIVVCHVSTCDLSVAAGCLFNKMWNLETPPPI